MDCAGIALVDEFDVVRELGEVCGEGVEDGLSLRRGGHGEWVSPVEPVGRSRRVGVLEGWEVVGLEARGRASRSLGVRNYCGRGTGWVEGSGSQA